MTFRPHPHGNASEKNHAHRNAKKTVIVNALKKDPSKNTNKLAKRPFSPKEKPLRK